MITIENNISLYEENTNDETSNKETLQNKPNNHLVTEALVSNNLADDVLHVVAVISNVCEYKRRWQLFEEFVSRMEKYSNVKLYVVELAYGNQDFHVTSSTNPFHLQLRTQYALWHKENLINLGIRNLLPPNWNAVAWIDADIEFENPNWVIDTLKVLTKFDVVQLFTTCFDLDQNNVPMSIWQSFGYKYCNGAQFEFVKGINYWHCGYAWACTRAYYEKVEFLYDKSILGSADFIMTQGYFKKSGFGNKALVEFRNDIKKYVDKLNDVKIGFIPTNIKHYFHGSKANRKYTERNQILIKHNYNPNLHLRYNEFGLLVPTEHMGMEFLIDIYNYFRERNEDECFNDEYFTGRK